MFIYFGTCFISYQVKYNQNKTGYLSSQVQSKQNDHTGDCTGQVYNNEQSSQV